MAWHTLRDSDLLQVCLICKSLTHDVSVSRWQDAKFQEAFLDGRARALQGYLSQMLALQGGGDDTGLGVDVLAHALRPLVQSYEV